MRTIAGGVTAWSLVGRFCNHVTTIYFLPSRELVRGNKIMDLTQLQRANLIFLPAPP